MTVAVMRNLLDCLEDDMLVVMDMGEGVFVSVCKSESQVVELAEVNVGDDLLAEEYAPENLNIKTVLLLSPCTCGYDLEIGDVNSQPELN